MGNQALLAEMGTDSGSVVGRFCPEAIHGTSEPYPGCPLEEAVKRGGAVERDLFDERTARWLRAAVYPTHLATPAGDLLYLHFVRDITRMRRVEEEGVEVDERFRSAFEHARVGMAVSDTRGRYVKVNRALCEILGYSEEELLAMDYQSVTHPDDLEESLSMSRQVLGGERDSFELQKRYVRKDGRVIYGQLNLSLVRDSGGRALYGTSQIQDVTGRTEAEDALRKSEANYRAIFDAANDAIFVHDADTGAILDVNRKMREMYGYSAEETRSLRVEDLSAGSPPYSQVEAVKFVRAAAKGKPQLFEWLARDKRGRLFWVEVNLKRATIGGEESLLAIVRDISERKKAEGQLRVYGEQMAEIAEIATELSSELSVNRLLPKIARRATQLLGGDAAAVAMRVGEDIVYPYLHKMPAKLKQLVVKGGGGIAGYVVSTGQSVNIPDYPGDPRAVPEFVDAGLQTLVAAPLAMGSRVFGAIGVFGLSPETRFTDEQVALLEAVAKTSAVAIDKARAYEKLQRQEKQMTSLYGVSKSVASDRRIDRVLEKIGLTVCRNLAADKALVSVLAGERLYYAASCGVPDALFSLYKFAKGEGVCGRAASDGRATQCADMSRHPEQASRAYAKKMGIKGTLSVPIRARRRVLGTLNLYVSTPRQFDDDEVKLAAAFADQAAIAIENAEMYDDLQRRHALQLELLHKVMTSEEDERNRLAGALHDDVLQSTIAALYHIQAAEGTADVAQLGLTNAKVHSLLLESVETARELIVDLRPPFLRELGFVRAVRKLAERFEERSHVRASVSARHVPRLSQSVETALYRVVQEALANVEKHSGADKVTISVSRRRESVELRIRDNGVGFERMRRRRDRLRHFGLSLMAERAMLCGGILDVDTALGEGTLIRVAVPLSMAVDASKAAAPNGLPDMS